MWFIIWSILEYIMKEDKIERENDKKLIFKMMKNDQDGF
jgi:hypothetical protein